MSNKATETVKVTPQHRNVGDRKKKLGKGLGALLGETKREEPLVRSGEEEVSDSAPANAQSAADSPLKMIPIATIKPLNDNPRKHFDEKSLDELAASIAARGVIQPIIVRPIGKGGFQLVAGERRWRAAQKARLHEIPALVRELGDREVTALALIENLQREDLNPVEEARAYQKLADREGMTQAEIARMVEKSRSHVANVQRLLTLPEAVLDLLETGNLSMGHARALIGHENAASLAEKAVAENLSVRDIEKMVRKLAKAVKKEPVQSAENQENADIAAVQRHLEEYLGLKVIIKPDSDPRSGGITIKYATLDQLDLVCQRLTGGEI